MQRLMGKIKGAGQCPREKIQHMRGEIKCEGVKERITGIIKGTRAKEENGRLRVEMKGEDGDEGKTQNS